jgi:lysophospholipase L1-like esterase
LFRSIRSRIFAALVVILGLTTLVWGVRMVNEGDTIMPPPATPATLGAETAAAGPSSSALETGVRHAFTPYPKVAVLGDSFATGYGSDRGWGWVEQLAADMCWSVTGKSAELETGYTSPGGNTDTSVFGDRVDQVVSPELAVVLVEGGVFDFRAPSEAIYVAASDVFQSLRSQLARNTPIVAIGPVAPPTVKPEDLARVAAPITAAATDTGAIFIDPAAENWLPDETFFLGGASLQPNGRGHTEFAKRLSIALRDRGIPAGC